MLFLSLSFSIYVGVFMLFIFQFETFKGLMLLWVLFVGLDLHVKGLDTH